MRNSDASASVRRRDPEEKRERLLAAARSLFVSQGFEKTTTKDIAKLSGVSEGILFHQFNSKVGILNALISQYADNAIEIFSEDRLKHQSAETFIRKLVEVIDKDRDLFELFDSHASLLLEHGLPTIADLIVPEIETSLSHTLTASKKKPADLSIMAEFQFSIVETTYRGWLKSKTKKHKEAFINEGVRSMNALLRI